MIAELRPYAEYTDSGLLWIGTVPSHWAVGRVKTVLQEIDRRSPTGTEPLLSLRMQSGLVDHHALGGRPIPPSALIGYKRVLPGEIVMNRMRASAGLFAVGTTDGLVSPDYAIFRVDSKMNQAYAVQLFRTPAMASVLAPRRFVWNPTVRIGRRRRARWACGQAAFEPVHMSTGRLPGALN